MPRRLDPRAATEFDQRVGAMIRGQRLAKGLSQTQLANRCGVTFQQVQKYEKGMNRVPPGRLEEIAGVLDMKAADFFSNGKSKAAELESLSLVQNKLTIRLLRAFNSLDWRARKSIVEIAEKMVRE